MTQPETNSAVALPRLKRVLTLWDLIFYGIILIMPIAPVPLFGIARQLSRGHFVTTILIAMVAMMLTAVSYGRTAALYPGALLITYEQAGEILNFGAFLAFIGVNVATFWQFTVLRRSDRQRHRFADALIPLLGFVFCLWIWLGLKTPAKVVGGIWLLAGFAYSAIRSRGLRTQPVMIDFSAT